MACRERDHVVEVGGVEQAGRPIGIRRARIAERHERNQAEQGHNRQGAQAIASPATIAAATGAAGGTSKEPG